MGGRPEALAVGWDRQKRSREHRVTFWSHTKPVAKLRVCVQLSHLKSSAPALPEGAYSLRWDGEGPRVGLEAG